MKRILCLVAASLCVHLFSFGQITVTPAAICPGKTATLSIVPIAGSTYRWQHANISAGPYNNVGGATSPSYTTNNAGWYRILTGPVLEDTSAAVEVAASLNPVASFTFNNAVLCAGEPIAFTNTSGAGTCQWYFGNPASDTLNSSTEENPVHAFVGTPGTGTETFTVKLVFTNAGGCRDSITHDITVKQPPGTQLGGPGAVVFEGHNYFKLCGTTTTFTFINLSTTTATNTNYQIIWGDGSPDFNSPTFAAPIPHIYTTGTHLLQFIVAGPNGCTDTADYYVFLGTNPAVGLNNPGNTTICSATPLTFPISGTGTNSPGTMYTVTFNDGTPPITFPHPAPAFISHIFLQSSCGTSSGGYANSYSAMIQASNPCFTSSATVVPIFVSGKTETRFDILPQDTICVNTVATFNNTTLSNVDNQNGICKINQAIWQITPATGWTVTSGTLGNDFGSNDVSLWVLGSTSLSVRFTVAGTYAIKLKTGNAVCGNDSLIKTICVNPLPLASFTADNISGCAPVNVSTTNNSNSPLCGSNTYLWSVSFAPAGTCVQTSPTYTYTNGTSAASANPQFQFNSPGVYTITLVTRSSAGLCLSVPFSRTITVKGKPVVTLATVPPACANANVNPSATVLCFIDAATTYAWSFPGGNPSSSSAASPGTVTYATPGTYTISLSVTNECGTTAASQSVTVKPVPDFTVPADVVACPGTQIGSFSFASIPPGASFSWINSNAAIGLAASGNGAIPVFTAANATANPITATITITAALNGCTRQHTFTVTVNSRPAAPAVVTLVSYCKDDVALPLSATATTGNTLHWYNVATGGTELNGAPTPSTAASGTFNYWVSQTNAPAGCEGPRAMITVTVKPVPVINTTFSNPASCGSNSGSITITGLVAGTTYIYSYVNTVGTVVSQAATSVVPGVINITNLPPGTYTNIFVVQNGCVSNAVATVILTTPTTPAAPVASNNGPVCAGTALTLSASNIANGSYHWTGPNGFNALTQSPTIPAATISASGTYTVTVSVAGCVSLPATTDAVVSPSPSAPVAAGNTPICAGTALNLTASSSAGAAYSWTGPNGFTSTNQNPVISNATTAASGTYTVTASIGSCTKTSIVNVVVNAVPSVIVSSSNPTACGGTNGSITISGLQSNTAYTFSYVKNAGAPITGSLTSNAVGSITISNLSQGTYTSIFVTLSGCPSNLSGPIILSDPALPATPTASTNAPVCSGTMLTLSASTAGAATYTWSGPNGFNSTQQNPSIANAPVAASGTYHVTATVSGCTSLPGNVAVVVNPTPVVTSVSSNTPICSGSSINLFAASSTPGALTYTWAGPNGFSSTQQNPVIANAASSAGGTYTVAITLGACTATGTTPVVVKPTPVISTSSAVNPSGCSTATGSILLNGLVANGTYTVSYIRNNGSPSTITLTASGSGTITIGGLTAGTYSNVFVTINNCLSASAGPFVLTDPNPPAAPNATSNQPVCSGGTLTLSASTTATGTATFLWSGPNGFSSTAASPVINSAPAAASGIYLVTVTVNNCTSPAASLSVVVNPLPAAPITASPINYCIGVNTMPLTASVSLPANTLLWYTAATGGAASLTPPVPSSTIAGTTDYYVSQRTAAGCEGPRALIRVIINPNAVASFVPTTAIGCPPFNITPAIIGLQPSANNSTYSWYANEVLIGTGTIFPGYTIADANDSVKIKLVVTSVFGCRSDSISRKFYTYKVPQPSFTQNLTHGCGPLSVQLTNTTPNQSDFTYSWNFGNGQTSTLAQPGTIIFQPSPTYTDTFYVVKLTVASVCQTITYKDTVFVSSKPKALFTPSNVNGCSPMRVRFTNTSLGIGNSYHWDFDDGQVFNTTLTDTFTHIFYTGIIDTFHVKLIVTNACGSDSISYSIIAAPNNIHLNYSLNGTSQYGCAPHAVAFYNNTSGAGSFQWSFGDGAVLTTTNNIDTIYHTYNLPGAYTVHLTALNNCTDTSAERTVTVYPKPVAAFSADRFNACVGEAINFTDNSAGSASRTWYFGDGASSNIATPAHSYAAAGTYIVKLVAYNANPSGNVCSDSTTQQIVVVSQLPADISVSSTSGPCAPFTVTFTNNITPTATATWDFGDGQSATGDAATHTYTTAGTYIIHFSGTVPGGCHYVKDETITVGGPAGSLAYTGGYVCGAAPVSMQAAATNATGYQWSFGDGTTQTTTTPQVSHIYSTPGTYIPSVTLLGAAGCTSLLTGLAPIKVDRVAGGFKTTQSQGCGSTEVNFTDTSFAFFGKALIKWKFGDSQEGTGLTINHTYLSAGNYNIEMIVIGNSGCTDTVRKTIAVTLKNRPAAVIQGPTEKCALENATFTANITSADAISFREWLLSNGAAGSGNAFVYNFSAAGNYTLRLIAGTVNGCYDTTYHNVLIKPVPVIIAGPDITLCRGASATLSVAGGSNYQWGPLQGLSCTTCASPTAAPAATTPYIVSGTNAQGCSASDTLVMTVIQPMHLLVSPNPRICIGDSVLLNATGAATYTWSPGATLNNATISNPYASPTATTTYRVIGYDGHSCFTDTSFVTVNVGQKPTVNLGADITLANGTQYPLIATITNGPIQQWLWTPATDLSCSTCPQPVATIKKDITYSVKVTTAFGCEASDAITIKVFCAESQVFIPNAFTPDGDGVNDIVMVRGKGIVSVKHFRIFNRWGELVFEKSNFPPNDKSFAWDGKVKGKLSQPEVFVYTAEAMCDNGSTFIFKGNISLIK